MYGYLTQACDIHSTTTGGMGRGATTFYKRFASITLNWIRCRLSFALLRASIMAIRGARLSHPPPATGAECPFDLQVAEGHFD